MHVNDTILYTKCDYTSDLWNQYKFASEIEFNVRDTGLGQEVAG